MPKPKQNGFTIIELMIVVAIFGVLTAALYNVLKIGKHRQNAQDAIMRENLEKTVSAVENYRVLEKRYPSGTSDPVLNNYLASGWLDGHPTGAVYSYNVNGARTDIGLMVTLNTGRRLKYRTAWAQIRECGPSAVISDNNCP